MKNIDQVLDEMIEGIDPKGGENRALIAKIVRQKARITCRELGAILGYSLLEISEIEHGRIKVSDNVITAWWMICAAKLFARVK